MSTCPKPNEVPCCLPPAIIRSPSRGMVTLMALCGVMTAAASMPLPAQERGATAQPLRSDTGRLSPSWKPNNGRLTGLTITHENDLIYEWGTRRENYDRNYTGAFVVSAAGDWVYDAYLDRPGRFLGTLLGHLKPLSGLARPSGTLFYSASLVATAFTPDSLNTPRPLFNDRPYASLTALSVRRIAVNDRDQQSAWTTDVVFGVLGLDFARRGQSYIHHKLRNPPEQLTPYIPEGWGNQVSAGGELTGMYRVAYDRFLFGDAPTPSSRKHFQVSGGVAGTVGYYTTASAALGARLGWFQSEFWENLPGEANNANQAWAAGGHRTSRVEAFLQAGIRPRYTLYNALLQGQFRDSPVTFTHRDLERAQVELDVGAVLFIPICDGGIQLSWFPLIARTREAKMIEYRVHRWGSASVGMSFGLRRPGQSGG